MQLEKKEKYTLISSDENSFNKFYTSFLEVEISPGSIENLQRPRNLLKIKKKFMDSF